MEPLAQPDALAAWLGESVDDDYERAVAVLDHASTLVRVEAGVTWEGTTAPDGIAQLVVRVGARLWLNPSGLVSSTTGPFSGTFGSAGLTDDERAEIWRIVHPGQPRRGLGTISTTRGPLETPSVYVDVVGSDKPLPSGLWPPTPSRDPW